MGSRVRVYAYNHRVEHAQRLDDIRRSLAARGRVVVQVSLPSGPCWVSVLDVIAARRNGPPRVLVELAGARVYVAADAVLEVLP